MSGEADKKLGESEKEQSLAASSGRAALLVGTGILLSRIAGLVRERTFAHYFGNSDAADAFKAALRIPNFLQNLFGEGVLSASFIPVYARLVAEGKKEEAQHVARLVGLFLFFLVTLLATLGVLFTPVLIDLIAPGFTGEKREAAIKLVSVFFPGIALLVLSAWCLGILNSHRKFLLSYSAPVFWNLTIIAALLLFGATADLYRFAVIVAWSVVVGSALQFGVQVPQTLRLLQGLRAGIGRGRSGFRTVLRNFGPVVIGRGVTQISAYIDSVIASYLPTGAVAGLAYAQNIYLLPVSLFGIGVSAAELPQMSSVMGTEADPAKKLRVQLEAGIRRISFFVVPSVLCFLALGDVVVGALCQSGQFSRSDTVYVWGILAGSTVGLLASTNGRLFASAFYALHDTRTPLKFAVIRVVLTTIFGLLFAFYGPGLLGIDRRWGVAGLTSSAGIAAWLEFLLLRSALTVRIGEVPFERMFIVRLWAASSGAALISWIVNFFVKIPGGTLVTAAVVLTVFGLCYLSLTMKLHIPEAHAAYDRGTRLAQKTVRLLSGGRLYQS